MKVARDSFPEVGTLPRVPAQEQTKPYIAQARHYIEQRGQTDMRNILIDTVVVTHRIRQEMKSPEQRLASNSWTAEQIKESGAGTILECLARMPGIKVSDYSISYRGTGALFVVDGQLEEPVDMQASGFPLTGMVRSSRNVSRGAASGLGGIARPDGLGGFTQFTLAQQVMCLSYPLEMVSRIDLIDSHDSALYIPWAKGAVVSITLKERKGVGGCSRADAVGRCGDRLPAGLPDPCGILRSGIRDGESPPFDGSRLPHDALLEPDCQA